MTFAALPAPGRLTAILACGVLLAACGGGGPGGDEGPDDPLEAVEDTLGEDTTLAQSVTRGPPVPPGDEENEAPFDTTGESGEGQPALTFPEEDDEANGDGGDALPAWTTGTLSWEPESRPGSVVLEELRAARHDGYDRWVLHVRGDAVPGYAVEYVDEPLTECGSGRQIHPVGEGWLQLRLDPARGHDDAGEATLRREWETPGLTRGLHVYRTCDFEGTVTLVFAVDSPEPFRAFRLDAPNRVVVDVRH